MPELLKLTLLPITLLPIVEVPALTDLRNVPALSNRIPLPDDASSAAFWTWNNAPGRFVMTAPEKRVIPPPPIQLIVPLFSRIRPFRVTPFGLSTASVAPAEMRVFPLPLMVPDVHKKVPPIVNVPLPVSTGLPVALPSSKSRQPPEVFKVTVAPMVMEALSLVAGTRLGVQFVVEFQSLPARPVQVNSIGVKRAYTVLSFVITRVTGLFRVTMSPSQAWKLSLADAMAVSVTLSPLV